MFWVYDYCSTQTSQGHVQEITHYKSLINKLKNMLDNQEKEFKREYDAKYSALQAEFTGKSEVWHSKIKYWKKMYHECDKQLKQESERADNMQQKLQKIHMFVNNTVNLK